MKKLLSFVFVAFMFVACGDSPESIAKKYMTAVMEADMKQAVKYLYFGTDEKKQRVAKEMSENIGSFKKYIAERGGVKSIDITLIEMNKVETKAKVKSTTIYNNGETQSEDLEFIKIDGTWYIDQEY